MRLLALAWLLGSSAQAWAAQRVQVGAYLNDIHDLDLKTHSYSVDLYVWLRWTDPALDPANTLEFVNPYELWGHTRTLDSEKPRRAGGELYQVLRGHGRFSRKLPLDDYPFDRQTLVVEFEDARLGAGELVFDTSPESLAVNPELQLPGFRIGRPSIEVRSHRYPTGFGDPRGGKADTFSRVRIEVPIERPILAYAVKLLLPVLCVIVCAAFMFAFHPKYVDSRVGIGITALLTIVALQITLNDELPEVGYLVLMDKVYLGAYLFVLLGMGVVVRTTWMLERGKVERAVALDRRGLALLLGAFLLSSAVLIGSSLRR